MKNSKNAPFTECAVHSAKGANKADLNNTYWACLSQLPTGPEYLDFQGVAGSGLDSFVDAADGGSRRAPPSLRTSV